MTMDWPRASGAQCISAELKVQPEDFQVDEILGFEPSGDGEHLFVEVEKRDLNTADVAKLLSGKLSLHPRLISWSGLKDRRALTRQWFSLHLPGRADPLPAELESPGIRVLRMARNRRKLQRGSHRGNRFRIRLNAVAGERAPVDAQLQRIAGRGVPNYFGEQRFGWDGGNIDAARDWFARGRPRMSRPRQSMLLSAARAWLFNGVLGARVAAGTWDQGLPGECYMLAGSASLFLDDGEAGSDALAQRLRSGDIHPTGPLPGKPGRGLQPGAVVAALEAEWLAGESALVDGLAAAGVDAARRSLRMIPEQLQWHWDDTALNLSFELPRGCFATALVREFCAISATDRATGVK